jgi:fermentation-respiration switch protein FrsA (DUF1100 family)
MFNRSNVQFTTDNNVTLRGWFYSPTNNDKKIPCIIMTHGFSALKEHYLDKFARQFAENGMCVLVYDNRSFGESDGTPRFEVDPVVQIRDLRNAITYVQQRNEVDQGKIGLWGTSFSGGIVLVVSAIDRRVGCVVAQVPFVSGHHKALRLARPEQWDEIRKKYDMDRLDRLSGKEPAMVSVVTDTPEKKAIMKIPSAFLFFKSVKSWENKVTLRSVENSGDFEPVAYVKYISPTPVLFIVANKDTVNTTDLALSAFNKAIKPKKLVIIDGDHFVPYIEQFEICANSASEWFSKHLLHKALVNQDSQHLEAETIGARL